MAARWVLTFEAVNPNDPDKTWRIGIPEWLYRVHQRKGHEAALAHILLIAEVIEGGSYQIFRGWSRPGKDEGCHMYVGYPSCDRPSLQIQLPPIPNHCFCVFVLPDGSIDNWTWRRAIAEGDDSRPQGVSGELIWPLPNKSRSS